MTTQKLSLPTKFLCPCAPGSDGCPICQGLPGALPLPSGHALRTAIRAAQGLGLPLAREVRFLRRAAAHPRGYLVATSPLTEGPTQVWLEEDENGETLLRTGEIGMAWVPFVDLPPVLPDLPAKE